MKSGTFNFWIDRETHADAFTKGVRCRWGSFEIEDETCVICSDGPTLAATIRMGAENQLRLFRVPFSPPMDRRHLVTIGWSKGSMKVFLDSKLIATVPLNL